MKKIALIIVVVFVITGLSAQIDFHVDFETPQIKNVSNYDVILLEDTQQYGEIGQPSLPWLGVKLLVPQGHVASDINIAKSGKVLLSSNLKLLPIQKNIKLSDNTLYQIAEPLGDIYYDYVTYPESSHRNLSTHFESGYSIAFFAVTPIEYDPLSGETWYYQHIDINVSTTPSFIAQNAEKFLHNSDKIVNNIANSVNNPEMIDSYIIPNSRDEDIDYLIIAEENKVELWQDLASIHNGFGRTSFIETVENIYNTYDGVDSQDKIRNYLIDMYDNNAIQYVLLAGDTDVIPHRGLWSEVNSGGTVDFDIPADMYYCCLDRGSNMYNGPDWNNDNDDKWGEEDEADLIPEFAIGRFPYNSDQEIQNFIHKVSSYMNYPVAEELTTSLLIGEDLGWEAWGGDFMDELVGTCSTNGHTTTCLPETWDISTLYDREGTWGAWQLFSLLSEGNNLVNHLGHSNTTYNMKLTNSDVTSTNITNDGLNQNYSIFFTQGCYAGAFDNRTTDGSYTADCITEKFTSISTAAASMISHSRYGWGSSSGTGGASQFYHREYLNAVFSEEIYDLGYALNKSKIEAIPFMNGVMYWVSYETNLIGDPGLIIWTEIPSEITVTHSNDIVVGSEELNVSTGLENATISVMKENELLGSAISGTDGSAVVYFSEPLENLDQITVQVTKHNYIPYHGTINVVPANAPYIICNNVVYEEIGDYVDGVIQSLDILNLDVSLENIGLQNSPDNITIELTTESTQIEILNGSTNTGMIESMETSIVDDAFQIQLVSGISNNTNIVLTLSMSANTYNWQSDIILNVKAPILEFSGFSAVAISGDNGLLDPGESGNIQFSIDNIGEGSSYNISASLYTVDPYLTINSIETIDVIEPGNSYTSNNIQIDISENCPNEYYGQIEVLVYDEVAAGVITSFQIPIGVNGYDFENNNVIFEHSSLSTGFTDQWHLDNFRNHTDDGQYSMKCGGENSSTYNNSLHAGLYTPPLSVSGNSFIKFWHWMDAEVDNGSQAWDGGNIMISINGGDFDLITPVGGYPYTCVNNDASPFSGGTPLFSGSIDWSEVEIDLTGIIGEVVICFVFGTDGFVAEEGWYIDDITMGSYTESEEETIIPMTSMLNDNYPNPFNPTTEISYQLAANSKTELTIYNVKGQLVRKLINDMQEAGYYNIIWDGKNDANQPVSSGVYFYQLKTAKYHSTKKMLMIK